MTTYLFISGLWVYFCVLCPLAYYIGFYGAAAFYMLPNVVAVWLGQRRLMQDIVAYQDQWEVTFQRKPA